MPGRKSRPAPIFGDRNPFWAQTRVQQQQHRSHLSSVYSRQNKLAILSGSLRPLRCLCFPSPPPTPPPSAKLHPSFPPWHYIWWRTLLWSYITLIMSTHLYFHSYLLKARWDWFQGIKEFDRLDLTWYISHAVNASFFLSKSFAIDLSPEMICWPCERLRGLWALPHP